MIILKNVSYDYKLKAGIVHAVRNVSAEFEHGKVYSIMGRSGSGKSTLLSLIAGLDIPKEGSITIDGYDLSAVDRDDFRRENIGMVFQSFYLLPQLTVSENIMLSNELSNKKHNVNVNELLERVGLTAFHGKKRPFQLSGGEQQRVAVARAIATEPGVILADEPTGNLDNENSKNIIGLLKDFAHEKDKCVIVVTHSGEIASETDVRFIMNDGELCACQN